MSLPTRHSPQNQPQFAIIRDRNIVPSVRSEAGFLLVEEIWVNVEEGAQRTGYHLDYVRRLARENLRLPEDERSMRVRKEKYAYEIWLPDLVNYVTKRVPANIQNLEPSKAEEIWVNASEAAEIIGYHRRYVSTLAMQMLRTPEDEREIRAKQRSNGAELWLPDLIAYIRKVGRGPKKRHTKDA